MHKLAAILALTVTLVASPLFAAKASAQTSAKPVKARNVVLVHGAWADGSSWSGVISRLQAAGLHVTAVQNPLTSLADSVAATRRALALQDGPTVLVGHSWSGTVVSEVGVDPKVSCSCLRRSTCTRCRRRLSSLFPERSPPCRCGPASRSTMASPLFPKRPFSNISQTVFRAKRQKFFMPFKCPQPRLCSAIEPQLLLGAPSRASMRSRNSIRRYRLTWNDFWPHA